MYNCQYCNFSTNNRTIIYTHKKSQKHLLNKENYENKIKNININEKEGELESLKKKYYKLKKKNKIIEQLQIENNVLEIKVKQLEDEKLKSDVLINFYKETYIKPKYKKQNISKTLRISVWNKYFGEDSGKNKCMCCNITEITQLKFHCGHIIAERNGGDTSIDNLVPICESCNKSMGTQNLNTFKETLK
jgi:5-methylcytosine-specific restriction endonuclease McrA